jgi:DNA-binding IclR family transcriptional regulator
MAVLTPAHDAVLALLDWLPEDVEADAQVVAGLLGIPEAEAARLLDELETAGDLVSATGALQ